MAQEHQYVPPHVRAVKTPDKLNISNDMDGIFEPRVGVDPQNVTVRISSVVHSAGTMKNGGKGSESDIEPEKDDPDRDPPPINPVLMAMLTSIDDKLTEQGGTLSKMSLSQNVMQKSIEYAHANSSDLKDRIVSLEKENTNLLSQNEHLNSQARDMSRRLDDIEQQLSQLDHNNRRRNIIIDGVGESAGENTRDIAIDILSNIDPNISKVDIDFTQRVYRPGNKNKPILVVFKSTSQRDMIMNKKKNLKGHRNMANVWLNEDANPKIRKQKLESRSVARHAISKGYDAKQKGSGVVIDGRYYLCTITVDGKDHKSAEHFIQYTKVMLANLVELAQKIRDAICPFAAKILGGSVQIPMWNNVDEEVVKMAIREKFTQNPHLRKILLDTGAKTLLECTPDMKWGAGISLESKLFGTGKHPGRNLTGNSVQELRVEFRDMESQTAVPPLPTAVHGPDQIQSTGTVSGSAESDRPKLSADTDNTTPPVED